MSVENTTVNTGDEEKSTPTNEIIDTEDTEKSEDISVFDLETFQKQLSRLDGKKQKTTIVLDDFINTPGPSCERDVIGDDMNKKEQHIVCECEPNVAGAAVPAVCSFNNSLGEKLSQETTEPQVICKTDDPVVSDRSDVTESDKSESSKPESSKVNKPKKSIEKIRSIDFLN